ncbi:hypothetical protein EC991_007632 [Linnemannia zychae]|nr:hypothetical protein EC991_007632 [Linnemannia zychae]
MDSTDPSCTVKYAIRAVLQRPFPSLSNVEACQEVWVVHSHGNGVPHSHTMTKRGAITPSQPSFAVEEQTSFDTDSAATTATTTPFMSTPASKIASDWSASTSIASRKTTMTPMPPTPYGRNQLVVFIYYFCTIVLGLGFCKRYSEVIVPSSTAGSSSSSL